MSEQKKIPKCIGIIMDGNRRWAKEHNLPTPEGHRRGYEKLKEVLRWCKEKNIPNLVVYAFSTENWNRAKEEVEYLLDLFRAVIDEQTEEAIVEHVRLVFPGDTSMFPEDIKKKIEHAVALTAHFTDRTFAIALSYGGRAEIVDAIKRLDETKKKNLTEEQFSQLLWSSVIPDPDMIIRTSGEQRLSGFLTWKSVYSELFFTETYWPAYSKDEFGAMLDEFDARDRRYGK